MGHSLYVSLWVLKKRSREACRSITHANRRPLLPSQYNTDSITIDDDDHDGGRSAPGDA
jgi:hypothetical protein